MYKNKIIRLRPFGLELRAKRSRQAGFTLVELLVVIAIIGILSTVAVVNLNSAREKAKFSAAMAFAANYKAPAALCDTIGGQLGPYVTGGSFCCTNNSDAASCAASDVFLDVSWPTDLPEGYNVMGVFDLYSEDGEWLYLVQDTLTSLPIIICEGAKGCYSI